MNYSGKSLESVYQGCCERLTACYEAREANAIVQVLFAELLKIDSLERYKNPDKMLTAAEFQLLEDAIAQALRYVPVQYITGKSWFLGRKFVVGPGVLIPRPETEELVKFLLTHEAQSQTLKILDLGTGSGCIAASIKLERPGYRVFAADNSPEALVYCRRNCEQLKAAVEIMQLDLNHLDDWQALEVMDVMVSNPPYIPTENQANILPNVLDHEPHAALFTPVGAPLYFYEQILKIAESKLSQAGRIYLETEHASAPALQNLLKNKGYLFVNIIRDISGRSRFVWGQKS